MSTPTPTPTPSAAAPAKSKRGRLLLILTLLLLLAGAAAAIWWLLFARNFEHTDNAYVGGNLVQVTPQVGGTVISIHADDTQSVQAGATLVELDRSDAEVALAQAEAQLAQTVREVSTVFINQQALDANVKARSIDLERARADLARRQQLAGTGAVAREEIEHAREALRAAEAALQATREQKASNLALIQRTSVERHPNVQRAAAQVQSAYLALARTRILAPTGGYIARRTVQVGQRVAVGAPLLSIVPLDALWVDANFKEGQITRMRIGQPVTLHADLYGSGVTYHGKVMGLSAGTGAAFALLPPQNASGNWIKVVQRVPVRIALDPADLKAHPLRVGLSMQARVEVGHEEGEPVASGTAASAEPSFQTAVFDNAGKEAATLIKRIIASNSEAARP